MKEYIRQLLGHTTSEPRGLNVVREYLQARILSAMQREGAMMALAFQGGTALRFLYALPRHSEDLDFALERPEKPYDLRRYSNAIRRGLSAEAYDVEIRLSDRRTVHSSFIRFPGLLYELDLAPRPQQVLSVRIEVDTRPPRGARLETTVVRRHAILQLQHHDRASLFSGKLHAVLHRPYVKGRDVYDLLWYLSDRTWPEPNLELLRDALQQTGWSGPLPDQATWRALVRSRLEAMDWNRVASDVSPFLEVPTDITLLTRENLLRLLDGSSQ
ncbi:MAG: nucleotidyl transferase AbiEii/AbiGii toxin family protein [Vicinamibacteraceae bacterium]